MKFRFLNLTIDVNYLQHNFKRRILENVITMKSVNGLYADPMYRKVQVCPSWTKYLLTTHPVGFITTIGKVNGRIMPNVAPFATCLDTSYEPPYITFSAALKQHGVHSKHQGNHKMNTYLNIRQNGTFIVNIPDRGLLNVLGIIAYPYKREDLEDKIKKAKLTKLNPFVLSESEHYPPMIAECLAHLECRTVDIHRPARSDHYNITGEVVGASYDVSLGLRLDEIRENLVRRSFHHFGSVSEKPCLRFIGYINPDSIETITFGLEKK